METSLKTYCELDQRIGELERLAQEVKDLGQGLPVARQNARSILSAVQNLRYGISDLVEALDSKG